MSDRRDPRPGDEFPNVGYVRHMTDQEEVSRGTEKNEPTESK